MMENFGMIVEEITAMSILAVKNTPNSLKYMQKHINLWSQFQVIKVIKSSEMDIVSSRNVVGKHLKIIAFKFLKFSVIEITDTFIVHL